MGEQPRLWGYGQGHGAAAKAVGTQSKPLWLGQGCGGAAVEAGQNRGGAARAVGVQQRRLDMVDLF